MEVNFLMEKKYRQHSMSINKAAENQKKKQTNKHERPGILGAF